MIKVNKGEVDYNLKVQVARYDEGNMLAIQLIDAEDDYPYDVITTNVPEYSALLEENQTLIVAGKYDDEVSELLKCGVLSLVEGMCLPCNFYTLGVYNVHLEKADDIELAK